MTKLADEIMVPLPCPHCGHQSQETLVRLKDNPTVDCLSCGQTFEVASDPFVKDTASKYEIDRSFDDIGQP
jgi:uncharacterized Zn finger protein